MRGHPNPPSEAEDQPDGGVPKGSIPKEAIRRTVQANLQLVKNCYESTLMTQPDLEGRVSIKFIIDIDGSVKMAAVFESYVNNPELEKCIVLAVKSMRFPAPDKGIVVVTYPFDLTLPDQEKQSRQDPPSN